MADAVDVRHAAMEEPVNRQGKLFDPGRRFVRLPEREDQVQDCIVQGLRLRGYTVLVTSERRRGERCAACGHWQRPRLGRGTTPGIPDLLVSHPSWPPGMWLGIECKGTQTRLSPAQQELADAGRIIIARSWEDAWAAVEAYNAQQ